ncbi:CK5P3 protein, partial [Rhagologus leucostigma]|nr:CK5P3 protein [Rhagologus leucostigma]
AELSSLLGRSISYELPALRRQLGRCQQAQQELARREDECQLGAAELRERFLASCRQYGIAGADVRQELLAQVQALPSLLSRVGDGARALGEAIELYQACVAFVCDRPRSHPGRTRWVLAGTKEGTAGTPRGPAGAVLGSGPWLRAGFGGALLPQIDWGDFPAEPSQGGDVERGITVEPGPQGDDGIDWGDGAGQEGTITVVEAGTEAPEGVARGSDALTLLENPETRNRFVDELMEVGARGRPAPLPRGPGCPLAMQRWLRWPRLAPPRYVERVTALLRQKLHQAELLLAKRDALARKRREALAEQAALEPKLERLQEKTRELQKLIEADISKRYGGRPVNLMGIHL